MRSGAWDRGRIQKESQKERTGSRMAEVDKMIVFDIDDTLYLRSEPYLRAYRELLRDRYHLDEEKLIRANHVNKEEQFNLYAKGSISFEEMTIQRTIRTFRDMGVELSREEAAHFEETYSGYQKELTLFPAFRDLLEELTGRGIALGILTNGLSDRQRKKLTAMHADHYFPEAHVMASADVGIIKPGAGIFQAFEQKTGRAPDQLWMVGDSYESDIAGALGAGWHALWLDRKGEGLPEGSAAPDGMGKTEEEVCSLIRTAVSE